MRQLKPILLLAISALLLTSTLSAQRATGQVFGTVNDDQGSPLPGVSITAKGPRLVGSAATVTNAQGGYRLVALPPGSYEIEFNLSGFQPLVRKDVVVGAEQTLTLDVKLNPAAISEQVTVIGQSPLIDVKSTTRGAAMNRQVFSLLPKGRNFDSLLVTVPGVQREDYLAGTSVDGASGAENMWYVDGVSTTNLINGVSAQSVNYDFVEEVNFKSSGYNAEFGGSLGGVVNVLTRSGGNEFHGDILAYYTDEGLTARRRDILVYNKFDTSWNQSVLYHAWDKYFGKQKWYNLEGGFSLGGYVIKDRIWFFLSAMPNYNQYTRTLDYSMQGLTTPSRDVHSK
ncbi:MAG TPA: carboxypeptidase regulatory-like domain-containing protein, partial [Candidatus Aminicenantes bacterium]|nr:carboxypeptidase regulatory-like domain-containing protein [Candidatus Aminicenantes bacterium]